MQHVQYKRKISKDDHMVTSSDAAYFNTTNKAIECIKRALESSGLKADEIKNAMDYGCGYGRVYRAYPQLFPNAQITAVDLMKDAVKFCSITFGGVGIQSDEKFSTYLGHNRYDFTWLGSVFTHLPRRSWMRLLRQLAIHTQRQGIVVFSVHGKIAQQHIKDHVLKRNPHLIDSKFFNQVLKNLPEKGFMFTANEPGNHKHQVKKGMDITEGTYGFSFTTREWVTGLFSDHNHWELVDYFEPGWGHNHDAVVIRRR